MAKSKKPAAPEVPAWVPQQLRDAAARVGEEPSARYSVRTLLDWFGKRRRGSNVTAQINEALDALAVLTEPDYQSIHIGAAFRLLERPATEEPPPEDEEERSPPNDPTTRVSRLRTADLRGGNPGLVHVRPNERLAVAVTRMLLRDYSQIPVIASRACRGVLSWRSIATRVSQGQLLDADAEVREFMDPAPPTVSLSDSIVYAVDRIIENGYVLVRDGALNEYSGIVTAADLGELFRDSYTPFLLLDEIEHSLRELIAGRVSDEEIAAASGGEAHPDADAETGSGLTFGAYQALFGKAEIWDRFGLRLDRKEFVTALDEVREVRNAVMHFEPDRLGDDDEERLHYFSGLLRRLREVRGPS